MKRQVKRSFAKLPVVCFNGRDELTIDGYRVKANALSGGEVELTVEDKKKLEYSLRVFKGLAANASKQCAARGNAPTQEKQREGEST